MPSTITNSNKTHGFHTLPVSATAGVTDADIAFLSRFLVRSTNKTGGLPLEYPRRSIDKNQIGRVTHAPSSRMAGFERLRKVLDALVGIAVCGDTQRLALSVSLGAKVCITIAQNDECSPPKISEHLQNVWNELRELANMQRSIRHQCHFPVVLDLPEAAESSLPMANPVNQRLKSLKFRLQADIHQHCYMKSKQRISKYLGPFSQFYTFYIRTKGVFDPELVIADILFCLADISETVTEYKGKFDESGRPVDMKWSYLAKMSNVLLQFYLKDAVNVTARINDVMAAWRSRSEVKGEFWSLFYPSTSLVSIWLSVLTLVLQSAKQDLYTFDLMRALEKTVALHRLILELVSFVYSPRRWPILERELEVLLLRPATLEPAEPSADDMRRIVERAFNATPFATTRRSSRTCAQTNSTWPGTRIWPPSPFTRNTRYSFTTTQRRTILPTRHRFGTSRSTKSHASVAVARTRPTLGSLAASSPCVGLTLNSISPRVLRRISSKNLSAPPCGCIYIRSLWRSILNISITSRTPGMSSCILTMVC